MIKKNERGEVVGSMNQEKHEEDNWLQDYLEEDRARRGIEIFRFREEGEAEQETEESYFRMLEESFYEF